MEEWDNVAWFQHDWVWEAEAWLLGLALAAAVAWFVDGYRKYGYWHDKDDKEEE